MKHQKLSSPPSFYKVWWNLPVLKLTVDDTLVIYTEWKTEYLEFRRAKFPNIQLQIYKTLSTIKLD